ncbi:uncharacterized protein CIMG_13040 [Coccidioides immitis RS]|uniref:Uncharacterized protein n=1 Tax=Coccidioides immitis (strain RS) TaxID=246410 RepID=A0A0D8JW75_COCIM|nr:uncharacterized protein CIMG_13040 [Coccidioides immitis RS]KJF60538.1 hypothetical protein CIMG_13040 [Coccidioides immitis RS]
MAGVESSTADAGRGGGGARRRRDGLDEWRKEEWLACRLASRNVEFLLRLIGMARAQIQRNRANGVASGRGTRYLIPLRGHRLFHSPTSPSGSWTANARHVPWTSLPNGPNARPVNRSP